MCIKNTHFKCLKSYYRISRVEVTHLFLECVIKFAKVLIKNIRKTNIVQDIHKFKSFP